MIFRLSQKIAKKIKVGPTESPPLDANQYADWSAHLFIADRTQYVILTNTASLYSMVMYGRGIANDNQFIKAALDALHEFMADDGQEFIFRRFIAPSSATVQFSKALNRSVTGSMNDLVYHAQMWLTEGESSPFDASCKLNEMPMSALKYANPREVFKGLQVEHEMAERDEI